MGVFVNALSFAVGQRVRHRVPDSGATPRERSSLAAWLLDRFHHRALKQPRLALVERINVAPRQCVALIEADGQRLLVATSPDGAPAFYPLKTAASRSIANRSRKAAAEGRSA